MKLPDAFLTRPISHRGLHDKALGRAENSLKAFQAAIDADYPIELDLQISSDGVAMVFHDYGLSRLTAAKGAVAQHTAAQLGAIALLHDGDGIPTLQEVLNLVDGRVPLLIEIKDQDGQMGPNIGPLGEAAAYCLRGYKGPFAVMSFNPHATAEMAQLLPDAPRGLVTDTYEPEDWPLLPDATCTALREIADYTRTGSCFVSHQFGDLASPRIAELRSQGAAILCWTIKSATDEAEARKIADNITFERYLA